MPRNYLHAAKAPGTHPWAHHILPGSSCVAYAFYELYSNHKLEILKSNC